MAETFQIAPLRSLDDFLFKSARFQIPQINDGEKWFNRIMNNLIFYQTNYFFLCVFVFLSVGIFQSASMIPSSLMVVFVFKGYYHVADILLRSLYKALSGMGAASNSRENSESYKELITLLCAWIKYTGFMVLITKFHSALIFMSGVVLLCIFLILTHASLRLRNMENKWANKLEAMGAIKSPMGLLLQKLKLPHNSKKNK